MRRLILNIRIELLSDAIFSSGNGIPGVADLALREDSRGKIYLPGSTLKGLLRQNLSNYMSWTGTGTQQDLDELLGTREISALESCRRLVFSNLYPEDGEEKTAVRTFTAVENGVAKKGTLHTAVCLRAGTVLTGMIMCAEEDKQLIQKSVQLLQWIGLKRNRGFGHVRAAATAGDAIPAAAQVGQSRWLHYRLKLQTPMVITSGGVDSEDVDRKNFSSGMDHLPGSAVRGMVLSWLAQEDPQWFAEHKQQLLEQTIFRNALPLDEEQKMMPMPMGFYEDREQTRFYSVLRQEVVPGDKRARLGRYFCVDKDGMLLHSSPMMEQSLRISVADRAADRQMFTVEAMAAGTVLEGYIRVNDPAMAPKIAQAFRKWVWMGADRYAGNGLCSVELLDDQAPDYSQFHSDAAVSDTLYMLIVSPTALVHRGEVCGLTDETASRLLGVEARITRCATSVVKHSCFNNTWRCASSMVSMYAPGSIFRIQCAETPDAERLQELENSGIGIRRAEGCGQVLFLHDYDKIRDYARRTSTDSAMAEMIRQRQARCQWLLENQFPAGPSSSWKGNLQVECEAVLAGRADISDLEAFLRHNSERNGDNFRENTEPVRMVFNKVLHTPLGQTLGCPGCPDSVEQRLQLLCDWMNLDRKEKRT